MRSSRAWFVLFACAACTEPPPPIPISVMTLNVRQDVDWWEERFILIADVIARERPDLIALQEVELAVDQARILRDLLRERAPDVDYVYHEQLETELGAVAGEGLATFSRHPIVTQLAGDLGYGRQVILDRLQVAPGLTIDVYNTHLHDEGGDDVTKPQLDLVLELMRRNDAGSVTFLAGDLGAAPDSRTYRAASDAGLVDTFALVHGAQTEAVGNTTPIQLARTPVTQRPTRRVDYVFLEPPPGGVVVDVLDARLDFDTPAADGLYPSDHLGILTTVSIDTSGR